MCTTLIPRGKIREDVSAICDIMTPQMVWKMKKDAIEFCRTVARLHAHIYSDWMGIGNGDVLGCLERKLNLLFRHVFASPALNDNSSPSSPT